MRDLVKQEQFEIEVLDRLNSKKLLSNLIFCGGTMLRLCFGLNRFSVDLDFWVVKKVESNELLKDLKECLSGAYMITDFANKFHTVLLEIKSKDRPRSLKLEIRKEIKKIKTEQAIAYSKYSNAQVLVNVVSLEGMMAAKIEAFLQRKEIRDVFDMEFLLKKGVTLNAPVEVLERMIKVVRSFKRQDYTVKLGSLLEERERRYYSLENFKIFELAIKERISGYNNI